jgi:hypothetical protein
VSARTYVIPADPVQSTLRMHEGDPRLRSRITGNQGEGEYTHDISLRNAGTHRTNCVVTGVKMWVLTASLMTTCLCISYLSIPIMGRSVPCGPGNGPMLTAAP